MVCHREEAAAVSAAASYTFCTEKYKKIFLECDMAELKFNAKEA